MGTARRSFLRNLAALVGGAPFGARLLGAQGQGPVASTSWDVTWRDRITGTHRAVFDSPDIAGGAELRRASLWKTQIAEVYAAAPGDIQVVLVVRHRAMPMVMNDEFWKRHELGKKSGINDPQTREPVHRNPYSAGADPAAASSRRATIEGFLAGGGIVVACNIAFARMIAYQRAAQPDLSRDDARARAIAHLIPGVILQPSGFFAAIEAQRAGCGFFPSTGVEDV